MILNEFGNIFSIREILLIQDCHKLQLSLKQNPTSALCMRDSLGKTINAPHTSSN
jgi:hypothetical protein